MMKQVAAFAWMAIQADTIVVRTARGLDTRIPDPAHPQTALAYEGLVPDRSYDVGWWYIRRGISSAAIDTQIYVPGYYSQGAVVYTLKR